jgi:hypothetical protein
MIQLNVQCHGLDPRDRLHLDLNVSGSGEIQIHTPKGAMHFDIDVERLRHLLLMLDSMLEDYDKITLGVDRLDQTEDTVPL